MQKLQFPRSVAFVIIGLVAMTISLAELYATTVDQERVVLQSSRQTHQAELNTEKTHTQYRNETRAETCFRQVYAGSVPECRWVTEQICTRDYYGRVWCRPITRQVCYDRPVYRQEPYTCYRTVQVAHEVFDYYVKANTSLTYAGEEMLENSDNYLDLKLDGDNLSLQGASRDLFLFVANKNQQSRMEGQHKIIDASYQISGKNKLPYTSPFQSGLKELKLDQQGNLSFMLGHVSDKSLIRIHLTVERKKIGSNPMVFNSFLKAADWSVESTNNQSKIAIALLQLMQLEEKKKYNISVKIESTLNRDQLLNLQDVPALLHQADFDVQFKD